MIQRLTGASALDAVATVTIWEMSAVSIIVVAGFFLAALIAIAAVMAWQEAQAGRVPGPPTYVVEDAISTAWDHIGDDVRARVKTAGVRRIIEWEVFYLQGLADRKAARRGVTVVAGGDDLAVKYIAAQLKSRGHDYAPDDVRAVLAGEAEYLRSIGVIGEVASEPVAGEEM